jgi:hypothetical protein
VAYLPLEIRRAGHPEPAMETFTGRNGNFQAPDLLPGRYEIRMSASQPAVLSVEIPETGDGMYQLGDIVVPPAP